MRDQSSSIDRDANNLLSRGGILIHLIHLYNKKSKETKLLKRNIFWKRCFRLSVVVVDRRNQRSVRVELQEAGAFLLEACLILSNCFANFFFVSLE